MSRPFPEAPPDAVLTFEQAVAMLPDAERIHTYRNPAGALVGADWRREDVIDAIREFGAELSGQRATDAGHGLCIFTGERTWVNVLFVQTAGSR